MHIIMHSDIKVREIRNVVKMCNWIGHVTAVC